MLCVRAKRTPPAEGTINKPALASEGQGHRERKLAGLVSLLTGDKKQVLLHVSLGTHPSSLPSFLRAFSDTSLSTNVCLKITALGVKINSVSICCLIDKVTDKRVQNTQPLSLPDSRFEPFTGHQPWAFDRICDQIRRVTAVG